MGTPKALLTFQEKTFIARALSHLAHSQVGEIICVTGAHHQLIEDEIGRFITSKKLSFVLNAEFANGMLGSIQTGIRALDPTSEGFIITLADLPFVRTSDFDRLIENYHLTRSPLARFRHLGHPAHPVFFAKSLSSEILAAPAQQGGCAFLFKKYAPKVSWLEADSPRGWTDIDTPEDYHAHLTT